MPKIVFNVAQRRPGCVNLQAGFQVDWTAAERAQFLVLFPADTWLTSLDGMACYAATPAQWEHLSAMAQAALRAERP